MLGPYKRFNDIPQFTRDGQYRINVSWRYLEETIRQFSEPDGLDLDPDFQRAHVWTETQQIRYLEFILRNGRSGRDILFNKSGWSSKSVGRKEPMVLVDGKQRLQAVRRFMKNEILAFGSLLSEYEDRPDMIRHGFIFVVNDLATRAEVLQWYIDLNAGGVIHIGRNCDRNRRTWQIQRPKRRNLLPRSAPQRRSRRRHLAHAGTRIPAMVRGRSRRKRTPTPLQGTRRCDKVGR